MPEPVLNPAPPREPVLKFSTGLGRAYHCDSLDLLRGLPSGSVNLALTSPPYALHFQKAYGNKSPKEYAAWFLPFAREILRSLAEDGSFVLNIGGSYNPGLPTRSIYHFKLLVALVEEVGFHLAQECFWYNPAKMPMPAEWVSVRRVRVRDSVEYVWWLSKSPFPKASNRKVLKPYSASMLRAKRGGGVATRPGGHVVKPSFWDKAEGAIPPNVVEADPAGEDGGGEGDEAPDSMLRVANTASNDAYARRAKAAGLALHPARFPAALPRFFIEMLTDPGDLVADPFAGSLTSAAEAERLGRRWIAGEAVEAYLDSGALRFSTAGASERP